MNSLIQKKLSCRYIKNYKKNKSKKLEKKSLISYIYIGSPIKRMQDSYGTAARIQLNDAFASVEEIQELYTVFNEKTFPWKNEFS